MHTQTGSGCATHLILVRQGLREGLRQHFLCLPGPGLGLVSFPDQALCFRERHHQALVVDQQRLHLLAPKAPRSGWLTGGVCTSRPCMS